MLRLSSLCIIAVLFFALHASYSFAGEHPTVTGEYGKEGPPASGLGSGCRLAYQSSSHHLYLLSDTGIYGLAVSAGSATPIAGISPLATGLASHCGDPDLEVDNSGNGNLYAVPSSHLIYGWSALGSSLSSPWPVNAQGETCGVAVTATGEVWGGDYGDQIVRKFTAAGAANGAIGVGFPFCKLTVDPATNDLYVSRYNGAGIVKYTASSGYTSSMEFPATGNGSPGLAVNGAEHKLYVGNGSSELHVYDTVTGLPVETVQLGGGGGLGVAVDEGTDTLFATVGSGSTGVIKEYLGVTTPKATTGEPIGNSEVSGTADPNGVGPITECYFEFGLSSTYGSRKDCVESVPISSEEPVHANLPGLIGEETYHYRLVLATATPNVIGRGSDKTIVPHNVKSLTTEPATEVTSQSAVLNASFEGTNEDTHFYFEWGRTPTYGNRTAVPPGEDAGTTSGLTHISSPLPGLISGTTYHYRVVAENSIGISKANDQSFKTFEPPTVGSAKTINVTSTSADVQALVNPNGFETEYFVEYGTTPEYGEVAPVPVGHLVAGNSNEEITVHLSGLQGVTYHFRVVATSKWGTAATVDQTFNFFPPSCPNAVVRQQNGSGYLPDCRAYELVSPGDAGNVILRTNFRPAPYASNPPRFAYTGTDGSIGDLPAIDGLTVDTYVATRTDTGWVTTYPGIPGSEAHEAYFAGSDLALDKVMSSNIESEAAIHAPYVYDANEHFLGRWPDPAGLPGGDAAAGAFQPSPDFSHVAYSTSNDFGPQPGGVATAPGSAYDYDVASGTSKLISKTAGGADIPQNPANVNGENLIIFAGMKEIAPSGGESAYGEPAYINPGVSTDGSHILMGVASCSNCSEPDLDLYMTVNDAAHYDVSRGHAVHYVGMTADGSKVFFTSPLALTGDDHDTSTDLYMWKEGTAGTDSLTLVSAGSEGSGNSDVCNATWISKCSVAPPAGESETDTPVATETGDVFFYSPERLDGPENGVEGAQNLYIYRDGQPRFVTTLNASGSGPLRRFQVAPDGAHAAFITTSRLTSYDNVGVAEMYSYDAASGAVVCVSCIPSGEPPSSRVSGSISGFFMSNDGRTFFSTADSLVAPDTNEGADVYEYVDGRPQLITTGTGATYHSASHQEAPTYLVSVSADGVDVYFATFDTLVTQDHNGPFRKVYDARTGGGYAAPPGAPPCEAADECHGPGSEPPPAPAITSGGDLGSGGNAHPAHRRGSRHHHRKHRRHRKAAHKANAKRHRSQARG